MRDECESVKRPTLRRVIMRAVRNIKTMYGGGRSCVLSAGATSKLFRYTANGDNGLYVNVSYFYCL